MSGNMYLNDVDFTSEILACKKNGKLTDEVSKKYMLIAANMVNKHCYVGYPQEIKEDIRSKAMIYFVTYWKGFSIYRVGVRDFLEPYREKLGINKQKFHAIIHDILEKIENEDSFDDLLDPFGFDEDQMFELFLIIDDIKEKKPYTGAYTFFTRLCENAFKRELNNLYGEVNVLSKVMSEKHEDDIIMSYDSRLEKGEVF